MRAGSFTEDDLRMLDEYRRSFAPAFKLVFEALQQLSLAPTGRPEKSRTSLSGKLLRESARLSQVQDIAGCRVVVRSVVQQDDVIARLSSAFERLFVVDRRVQPSHGYRAVHAMVSVQGRTIEVQVRTELQHQWAEVSESLRAVSQAKAAGLPSRQEWYARNSSNLDSRWAPFRCCLDLRNPRHLAKPGEAFCLFAPDLHRTSLPPPTDPKEIRILQPTGAAVLSEPAPQ